MPELAHAPPPATDLDAPCLEAGCKLGDYRIVARLSSGGMATLYLARRGGAAGFSRFVAIKVVHPHLAQDTQFVRMFVDEAKLSSRIQHPNVVHVEELGEAEGTYYLVMEYVHGFSLAQVLAALARHKRRLSPALAVWIAMRVADGLHQAHETKDARGQHLGVVHRDVSPQNILLSTHGHIKLIDFGIAKAFGRQYQTVTGSLKGKLKYMAPEQARASAVDRRTDIYALGIVLWEMLAMRRLFKAENDFDLLEKVRDPEISSPRLFAAHDISDALERAVLSALAKDPAARPQSALHFMRALAAACPQAATIDASRAADLLREILGPQLDEKNRALPQCITGVHAGSDLVPSLSPGEAETSALRDLTAAPAHRRRSSGPAVTLAASPTDETPVAPVPLATLTTTPTPDSCAAAAPTSGSPSVTEDAHSLGLRSTLSGSPKPAADAPTTSLAEVDVELEHTTAFSPAPRPVAPDDVTPATSGVSLVWRTRRLLHRLWRPARRKQWLSALAVALLLGVLTGASALWQHWFAKPHVPLRHPSPPRAAEAKTHTAHEPASNKGSMAASSKQASTAAAAKSSQSGEPQAVATSADAESLAPARVAQSRQAKARARKRRRRLQQRKARAARATTRSAQGAAEKPTQWPTAADAPSVSTAQGAPEPKDGPRKSKASADSEPSTRVVEDVPIYDAF